MKINYKELTDEELALLGKNGDSQAVNELLLRYKAHAKEGCKKYFVAGGDLEDLAQEGLIAVYRAINTYKEGMDFKSYAKKCMKNAWISAIRKSNSGKNKPLNNYLSINGCLTAVLESQR